MIRLEVWIARALELNPKGWAPPRSGKREALLRPWEELRKVKTN